MTEKKVHIAESVAGTQVASHRIFFSISEKHEIIREYLSSGMSKAAIWKKYTGYEAEHGQIIRWMRMLGYESSPIKTYQPVKRKKVVCMETPADETHDSSDFESLQLKKRIAELEEQVKQAELKAIAFSTMVDLAEKEFNISIRKKYNTKPSRK